MFKLGQIHYITIEGNIDLITIRELKMYIYLKTLWVLEFYSEPQVLFTSGAHMALRFEN